LVPDVCLCIFPIGLASLSVLFLTLILFLY
jgi:hypothetical protein